MRERLLLERAPETGEGRGVKGGMEDRGQVET